MPPSEADAAFILEKFALHQSDPDYYETLLTAALDRTGDLRRAAALADAAWDEGLAPDVAFGGPGSGRHPKGSSKARMAAANADAEAMAEMVKAAHARSGPVPLHHLPALAGWDLPRAQAAVGQAVACGLFGVVEPGHAVPAGTPAANPRPQTPPPGEGSPRDDAHFSSDRDAGPDLSGLWPELAGLSRPEVLEVLAEAAGLSWEEDDASFAGKDQPRVPAGKPGGGRWVKGAGTDEARVAASDAVRKFAAGRVAPAPGDAEALAGHLSKLTVAQIHDLRREHGLRGSAPNKAALVAKLAERFRAHRERNFPESVSTPVDKGAGGPDNTPVGQTTPTGAKPMATQELPKLVGSEKQVAWAGEIRARALEPFTGEDSGLYFEDAGVAPEHRAAALLWLSEQTEARFWIDNRQKDSYSLGRLAARAVAPPPAVKESAAAGHDVRFIPGHGGMTYVRDAGKGYEAFVDDYLAAADPSLRGRTGSWVPAPRSLGVHHSFQGLPRVLA